MADWQTLIASLIPVVIGGLLVLGTQWVMEGRREKSAKRDKRVQKFEEFVAAIHENHHWLEQVKSVHIFGADEKLQISPATKALGISVAHFPEFEANLNSWEIATNEYIMWTLSSGNKRIEGDENYGDGLNEVWKPYLVSMYNLLEQAREFAKKEFQ